MTTTYLTTGKMGGVEKLPRPAEGYMGLAELRMTPDKGIGVFATQFIPKGQQVYEFEGIDFTKEEVAAILDSLLSDDGRLYFLEHIYGIKDKLIFLTNDGKFVNHSDNPNVGRLPGWTYADIDHGYALQDIEKGEELTEDYNTFCLESYLHRLANKYGLTLFSP
jgi:SET domain-containing protein